MRISRRRSSEQHSSARKWTGTFVMLSVAFATVSVPTGPAQATFPGVNGKIAFTSNRDGNLEIYVMNAVDGTEQTNLTNNAGVDAYPAWSPDGSKIAFTSYRDGNGEIYVMNADGTGPTRVTNNAAQDELPTWSPDGTKIAFTSHRDANTEIYVMNADGTGQTNLTNNASQEQYADWSPDGSKIIFYTLRDGNAEIYSMNPNGTGQANLTNQGAGQCCATWSPDGTKIAFYDDRDVVIPEIYVMDASGLNQTRLTTNSSIDVPWTWSPDGSKIGFETNRDGGPNEIYVMDAGGTNPTRLTNNSAADTDPDWQPLLQHRWLADGDATDAIGSNDGTLQGDAPHFATGQSGQAFDLDGSGDYVEMPSVATHYFPGSFSVSAWVKTSDTTGTQAVVTKNEAAGTETTGPNSFLSLYRLFVVDGIPSGLVRDADGDADNSGQELSGSTSIADGNFHHLRLVRDVDAALLALYVDEVLVAVEALDEASGPLANLDNEDDPLHIGARFDSATTTPIEFFTGLIDDVQILGAQRVVLPKPDGLIKGSKTPSALGNDIYNTNGANQTVLSKTKRGKKAIFNITVQNDSLASDAIRVTGCGKSKGFKVSYLDGATNVTSQVTGAGFSTGTLAPGGTKAIQLVIKVKFAGPKKKSCTVTSTSQSFASAQDAVRGNVKAKG